MRKFVNLRPGVRRFAFVAVFGLVILSPAITGLVLTGLVASAVVAPTQPARAESKIFFVENQPDGYGIDQCLTSGAKCGKPMARAYCQSREYGEAVSYRKADVIALSEKVADYQIAPWRPGWSRPRRRPIPPTPRAGYRGRCLSASRRWPITATSRSIAT